MMTRHIEVVDMSASKYRFGGVGDVGLVGELVVLSLFILIAKFNS